MVFAVEWLKLLGWIRWHFEQEIMEFSMAGQNYRLIGDKFSPSTQLSTTTKFEGYITQLLQKPNMSLSVPTVSLDVFVLSLC